MNADGADLRGSSSVRLGVHSYIFAEFWSDDRLEILDTACGLGAEFMEIGVGDDVQFTPRLTRQRAEALGLALCLGPGNYWPLACDLSSEEAEERALGLAWHRRQVDLAAEVGALAYGGALYGHPGVVKRRLAPPDEYERIAEGLHRLAEYGQQRGVLLVVEPMSHFRTHLANTPQQIMRLVDMADHPNLLVALDNYHMMTEVRDFRQGIVATRGKLWGLHACENDRGAPGGGLVPWGQVFAGLAEIAFDGYILLESYNSGQDDFAQRRGMFHNVCPDPVAFVRQGFDFIRSQLALRSVRL
jgi:D-psicose/D-tagatose/L-ribulose 3-epimerase